VVHGTRASKRWDAAPKQSFEKSALVPARLGGALIGGGPLLLLLL
jgi:hypothetical protein